MLSTLLIKLSVSTSRSGRTWNCIPFLCLFHGFSIYKHRNVHIFLPFSNRIMLMNVAAAEAVLRGGMFSKTIDENYVGWIIQLNPRDIVHLNACVALVSTWTEARGLHNIIPLSVLQRPNGFIHPANIGASPPRRRSLQDRSRTATCPKMKPQILNYVKGSVPVDLDLDKVMRFAGACK